MKRRTGTARALCVDRLLTSLFELLRTSERCRRRKIGFNVEAKMRSRMTSRNHPIQPLSPKHQPWVRMQAPDRKLAIAYLSRSPAEPRLFGAPAQTVEQELVLRARIEQRSAEKLEKLHEAVSHDRFVRRRQRQRVAGHIGDIVKQEMSKANA
ncbi:unnamed protein product [Calypogeia fissa]